jgi:hypothetical protein
MLSRIRCDNGLIVTKYIRVFDKSKCNNNVFFIITGSRVPRCIGEPVSIRI